jgi:hypothetical protein
VEKYCPHNTFGSGKQKVGHPGGYVDQPYNLTKVKNTDIKPIKIQWLIIETFLQNLFVKSINLSYNEMSRNQRKL